MPQFFKKENDMSNMKRRQGDRVKFRIGGFGSQMWGKICGHATRDILGLGVGWIVELDEKFPDYEYSHVVIHDVWIISSKFCIGPKIFEGYSKITD